MAVTPQPRYITGERGQRKQVTAEETFSGSYTASSGSRSMAPTGASAGLGVPGPSGFDNPLFSKLAARAKPAGPTPESEDERLRRQLTERMLAERAMPQEAPGDIVGLTREARAGLRSGRKFSAVARALGLSTEPFGSR
jgi:hypothetical protein